MWIENQDNLDKAQSLASQALSHLKLWGAEKLDQALVQPASRAIEHTAKTVKQAHAAAVDVTSDYVIAPTAKAWNAVAQGVTKKYEGAVAATSRGMENTANAGKRVASTVKAKHDNIVGSVVATAEDVRDVKNGVVRVANHAAEVVKWARDAGMLAFDQGYNPEKYQQMADIKQKPKTKVADKSNKPVWEKKNAG